MATINDFKREINKLVKTQKAVKRVNDCSSVYFNRGLLHAMHVAYYVLKHKLTGDAERAYYDQVRNSWKRLKIFGWCNYSGGDCSNQAWKSFMDRVDALISTYSDEEVVCVDRPEA